MNKVSTKINVKRKQGSQGNGHADKTEGDKSTETQGHKTQTLDRKQRQMMNAEYLCLCQTDEIPVCLVLEAKLCFKVLETNKSLYFVWCSFLLSNSWPVFSYWAQSDGKLTVMSEEINKFL